MQSPLKVLMLKDEQRSDSIKKSNLIMCKLFTLVKHFKTLLCCNNIEDNTSSSSGFPFVIYSYSYPSGAVYLLPLITRTVWRYQNSSAGNSNHVYIFQYWVYLFLTLAYLVLTKINSMLRRTSFHSFKRTKPHRKSFWINAILSFCFPYTRSIDPITIIAWRNKHYITLSHWTVILTRLSDFSVVCLSALHWQPSDIGKEALLHTQNSYL